MPSLDLVQAVPVCMMQVQMSLVGMVRSVGERASYDMLM